MGRGHVDEALELCNAACDLLDQTSEQALIACRVLSSVAGIEAATGHNPAVPALTYFEAASLEGDDYELSCALNLMSVGQFMPRDPAAIATADESVRAARASGSPTVISYSLFTAAMINADSDLDRAVTLVEESQRCAELAANPYALMVSTGIRTSLLFRAGHYADAASGYVEFAREARRYGRYEQQGVSLMGLTISLAALGNYEPGAVLTGWAETSLVDMHAGISNWGTEAHQFFQTIAASLDADRYAELRAQGAAMSAEEILAYAEQQTATR
jgi:hypothetical protein